MPRNGDEIRLHLYAQERNEGYGDVNGNDQIQYTSKIH
jgi:hypothetical protein